MKSLKFNLRNMITFMVETGTYGRMGSFEGRTESPLKFNFHFIG